MMIEGILLTICLVFIFCSIGGYFAPVHFFQFCLGLILIDFDYGWAYFLKLTIALSSFFIYSWMKMEKEENFEYFLFLLLTTIGSLYAVNATKPLILFLSLEIQAIGLCVLAAIKKKNTDATETALKYFFNTGLSAAFFLFGLSLIFVETGELAFNAKGHLGTIFILISFALKLSCAPFHWWAPDIYHGAPIAITCFLSTVPKLSLFPTLVRFSTQFDSFFFMVIAIFSFLVGGVGGLEKQNIKRLLSYGSIHFLGFIALGIATKTQEGFNGCYYALIIYALNMLTFFSILLHIKRRIRTFRHFSDLDGLSKFSPFLSICLSIVVLSFAGFPFFPGFLGKFLILKAAIYKKFYFLTFLALSTSILSSIYYLKFLSHMFLKEFSLSINPLVTLERTKFLVAIGIGLSYALYLCPNIIPKIHLSDFYMK